MPKRILVIDDDSTVSGLLYTHLSSEGYEVSVTSLAEQGFTEATQNPPSLILLDVQLPDATGFQVVGRLRSNPITRDVPIIMMSGAARFPSQQSVGRSMGANDYVLKPFEIAKISEKIQKLLQDAPDLAPSAQTPKPPATPVAENPVPSDPVKDELPQWIKPIPELKTEQI